jgi:hypothetical protein
MENDIVCYYELIEDEGGVATAVGTFEAEKWERNHPKLKAYLEKFGLGGLVRSHLRSKLDIITMQTNDTLEINRNRDYTSGCGRNAKVIMRTNYPTIHLRADNGRFIFPRVSEFNDRNFRDLRPVCSECGCVACEEHKND